MQGMSGKICVGKLVSSQERRTLLVPRNKPLINCSSTAGCVLPSVYMGFRLFVLPKKTFTTVSTMLWRAKRAVVSWANRPVGVPSCPAPPRPAALPCAVQPRPARGIYDQVLDSTNICYPDMLALKRITKTNKHRYIGQQPGTKSTRSSTVQPRILFLHSRTCLA